MTMCADRRRWPWSDCFGNMIYRLPSEGRIAGVCAGIARRFDVAPSWVRVATVASFFVIGPFVIFAYVVAVLALPTREDDGRSPDRPWHRDEIKREAKRAYREAKRAWRAARRGGGYTRPEPPGVGEPASSASTAHTPDTEALRNRFRDLDRRVAEMEAHIADREFDLAKAIDDLERK